MNAPVKSSSQSDGTHAATASLGTLTEENSNGHSRKPNKSGSQVRRGETTLRDFFTANPGEELTIADAAAKIGIDQKSAATYLARLKGLGLLERISIYRLKEET